MRSERVVLAVAVVAAPLPATARAQAARVELGVGSTLLLVFPTFGGHVSVPTHTGLRVEAGTQVLPWILEEGDDVALLSHAQLNIPVRSRSPRHRRGWLAGITAFTIGDRWDRRGAWSFDTIVRPHAGFSWQWEQTAHLDLRLDLQGLLASRSAPFVVPMATFSVVWHGERRLS
jgi:hypothetical protein